MIHCPNCNSNKVRAFDNQPLMMIGIDEAEKDNYKTQYDSEIYIEFTCDECDYDFIKVFDVTERK